MVLNKKLKEDVMSSIDNLLDKVEKKVGKENVNKAKVVIKKEAKKASDKIGEVASKKIKGVDADKVENTLNKYIDKYIK